MISRIITALVLVGGGGSLLYIGGHPLLLWVWFVAMICAHEIVTMLKKKGSKIPFFIVAIPLTLVMGSLVEPRWAMFWAHPLVKYFVLGIVGWSVVEVAMKKTIGFHSRGIAAIKVIALIGATLPFVFLVRESSQGLYLIFFGCLNIWAGDTCALIGGRVFGKTRLSELSPKKTIEGSIIGTLSSMLISLGLIVGMEWPIIPYLGAAFLVSIFAQIGDIHESLMKRECGVKDSSQLLPGHGGFYDRADSTLFAMPILYYLLV